MAEMAPANLRIRLPAVFIWQGRHRRSVFPPDCVRRAKPAGLLPKCFKGLADRGSAPTDRRRGKVVGGVIVAISTTPRKLTWKRTRSPPRTVMSRGGRPATGRRRYDETDLPVLRRHL